MAYEVEVGILEGDAACIAPTELTGVIRQEAVVTRGREEGSGFGFGGEYHLFGKGWGIRTAWAGSHRRDIIAVRQGRCGERSSTAGGTGA